MTGRQLKRWRSWEDYIRAWCGRADFREPCRISSAGPTPSSWPIWAASPARRRRVQHAFRHSSRSSRVLLRCAGQARHAHAALTDLGALAGRDDASADGAVLGVRVVGFTEAWAGCFASRGWESGAQPIDRLHLNLGDGAVNGRTHLCDEVGREGHSTSGGGPSLLDERS